MSVYKFSKLTKSVRSAVLYPAAIAALTVSSTSFAQKQNKEEVKKDIEVIEVKGIRASLSRALSVKQDATNFVDAISAEDVGKLPDQNIAETLQRVTGVSIQRTRGEGDFVSIRGLGPEFVRNTINGRTLVSATESFNATLSGGTGTSTGRETNLDVLPSVIINTLEVQKSASAEQVEGGIGGVVDIRTAKPLDMGERTSVAARATYREFNEELDPNIAALKSFVNADETMGFLVSLSYSDRNIREDKSESFGYLAAGPNFDTNGDGVSDNEGHHWPLSNNISSFAEGRERLTFNGTFQYAPDADTEFVLDVMYADRDMASLETQVILDLPPLGFGGNTLGSSEVTLNDDGSVTSPGLVQQTVDGTVFNTGYLAGVGILANQVAVSNLQEGSDTISQIAASFSKAYNDWSFFADASYVKAEGQLIRKGANIIANQAFPAYVDLSGGEFSMDFRPVNIDGATTSFANFVADEVNYIGRAGNLIGYNDRLNEDEELALKLDVKKELDNEFLAAVKFGIRTRSREKSIDEQGMKIPSPYQDITEGPSGNYSTFAGVSNFMDGNYQGPEYSNFRFADFNSVLAYLNQESGHTGAIPTEFNSNSSYQIEEDTSAAYLQADVDTFIGDMRLMGNFGIRYVETDQKVTGYSQPFRLVDRGGFSEIEFTSPNVQEIVFDSSYDNVLPSLNLRLELQEGLFTRLAASKTLTRPTFGDLAPSLAINATQATANGGNPSLNPYESTNFDLGLEYYFTETSAVYASYFTKTLDDFIVGVTNLNVAIQGVQFVSVNQPDNQGEADIDGFEIGVQHTFDFGGGFIVNYTKTDSSAEVNGEEVSLEGVSESTYNFTAFYAEGPIEARLAYAYRDDYLLLANDVFGRSLYADDYGQWDFSFNYAVKENIDVFFDVVNLTDETQQVFSDNLSFLPASEGVIGRRIGAGIRATF